MSDNHWDAVWENYAQFSDYSLRYRNFMSKIAENVPNDAIVLEAGCGSGTTLEIFPESHTTIGLDLSYKALQITRNHSTNQIQGDIFSIPFRDNSFDLVYNSGVIEHFVDPTNRDAVNEMVRVLKPGGILIIIVPNTLCIWYRLVKWITKMAGKFDFGYEEDYSPKRLKGIIDHTSVSVDRYFGMQVFPPLATYKKSYAPIRIRRILCKVEKYVPFREYYSYAIGVIGKKK